MAAREDAASHLGEELKAERFDDLSKRQLVGELGPGALVEALGEKEWGTCLWRAGEDGFDETVRRRSVCDSRRSHCKMAGDIVKTCRTLFS